MKFLWKGHEQEEYAPGLMEQDCEAREGRGLGMRWGFPITDGGDLGRMDHGGNLYAASVGKGRGSGCRVMFLEPKCLICGS